jgi:hypothetical protein
MDGRLEKRTARGRGMLSREVCEIIEGLIDRICDCFALL